MFFIPIVKCATAVMLVPFMNLNCENTNDIPETLAGVNSVKLNCNWKSSLE